MKNVMKRAWEIYRTLEGDRLAKLSIALRMAWAEVKKVVKLTGTEKQVKFAESIRENILASVDMDAMRQIIHIIKKSSSNTANELMETIKSKLTADTAVNNEIIIGEIKNIIKNETSAKWFIENQTLYGFMINYFA